MSTPLPVLTSNGRSTAFCLFTPDFGLRRVVLLTGLEDERREIIAVGDEVEAMLRESGLWMDVLTTMATELSDAIGGAEVAANRRLNELLWEQDREIKAARARWAELDCYWQAT